ncbi:hypothetical protein CAL22_08720 [Bordetella genomosp. 12]|uniref:Transposase n=1 Tax=Bordetella genomosp. 12 TaxID=463035 RepID=A0A261VK66_9BORD|nr:hypothetical protein CAL22_08720 [Bordetella genomosp. 12]
MSCRGWGISEATLYNWRKKYGDLAASEIRRLRQHEEKNARLKRVAADLTCGRGPHRLLLYPRARRACIKKTAAPISSGQP